jgi:hypothetical protein
MQTSVRRHGESDAKAILITDTVEIFKVLLFFAFVYANFELGDWADKPYA